MDHPRFLWLFQVAGPLLCVALLVGFVRQSARTRKLSLPFLVFLACGTMFWQETYGDWGVYLAYNRRLAQFPWGNTAWTSPSKPWALVAGYCWFYTGFFALILFLFTRLRRARPGTPVLAAVALVALPVYYAWDLVIEGVATRFGWWSYDDTVGPAIHSTAGTFPLLYPILQSEAWLLFAVWLLTWRDDHGRLKFEVASGVYRARAGWRQETAKLSAWVATMNVSFWLLSIFPLVLVRLWWGHASSAVP